MDGNQEGIGTLKLECPQMHSVGRLLKEAPYQSVVFDPGAQVGERRFWPDEADQPQFKVHCRHCDKSVGVMPGLYDGTTFPSAVDALPLRKSPTSCPGAL